jgi:hypothetical protein
MNPFTNPIKALWAAILVLSINVPSSSAILPPDRAAAWVPGLMSIGGIPNRSAIYTTLQASAYGDGSQDATNPWTSVWPYSICPAGW